ncbi:MAG: glycogen-debranching protein, partial [Myxococcales bacterium]|nr:glycogen-debranching protein [Myxococcales bacterium]
DLYSCDEKNNGQPWPYGPSDGGEDNNLSWSYGGDPVRQRQAARTGLTLLMLSGGVPMITGGDELYRSQACNNNAYNLDSEKNWLDWPAASADEDQSRFAKFAREVLRFRSAHPALRPALWPEADDPDGNGLGAWSFLTDLGTPTGNGYLDNPNNHFLAWRVDGEPAGDEARSIYVAYNGATSEVIAHVPPAAAGFAWFHVLDTASWYESEGNIRAPGTEERFDEPTYGVKPRAVLVLVERPE